MDRETEDFLKKFDEAIKELGKGLDILEEKMNELEKRISEDIKQREEQ